MTVRNRILISALLGCVIAGTGVACASYGLGHGVENTFGWIGLALNWHFVFLLAGVFPLFGPRADTVIFAGILPAIEWTTIVFFIMSFWPNLRKRRGPQLAANCLHCNENEHVR